MRKVVLGMNVSIDGFVAAPDRDPGWLFGERDTELDADTDRLLRELDTIVMGRVLYEEMVGYWPTADGERAAIMNRVEKVVFSRRPTSLDWDHARLADGSPDEELARLRRQPGGAIGVAGGARFAQSLARERLIDEYRLTVRPVALGAGEPLFADRLALRLLSTRRYPSESS